MNKEKLHKQVETMNKEQLIVLCKSLIDINCELFDRINKAIEYMELKTIVHKTYCLDRDEMKVLLDILRGNNE